MLLFGLVMRFLAVRSVELHTKVNLSTARERPRLPLRRELARPKDLEARLKERERAAVPEQWV